MTSLFWRGRRVLVTGAGGFIGSHLVQRLNSEGSIVRAFIRYNSRSDVGLLRFLEKDQLADIEVIPGDIRDRDAVSAAARDCQVIFHLGALISIPYSYRHPVEVAETNLLGTLAVLMACRDSGVERLVHASSSEVYGTALQVPINENHPLQGQSPYSASKIGADKLAESFNLAYDLPVTTVRPFNTYGPRQSARAVIPAIAAQVLTQQVVRLGNLEARRDFTYIDDTVNGFLLVAEAENAIGRTYNLGTGTEISIGDLAQLVAETCHTRVDFVVDTERLRPDKSEVQRLISDNALARASLGWQPTVALKEGLRITVDWIRSHLELYRAGQYEF